MALNDTNSTTVTGYFDDRSDAERAISALQDAGFTSAHIGVAHKNTGDNSQDGESVWGKVKDFFGAGNDPVEPYADESSRGGTADRTVTADPSSRGDAYGNDFGDTMRGMSVDEDRSKYISHRFGNSDKGAVVTVTAAGREAQAESILEQYGADLGRSAKDYDYASDANTNTDAKLEGTQNIQLLGEALRVHKDRVSRGEVTVRKEVITEMQTIQVPVTREELVIERHSVNDGTAVSGKIGDSSDIRIPLSEERASVDKNTFVREQVSVGKRSVQEVNQVSDEVRHEELVVEDKTKTGKL